MFLAAAVAFMVSPMQTPESFPDIPRNHWAYEAQSYLKSQGLAVGYPDGLGVWPRAASRYQFAVFFHAAGSNLRTLDDGLQELLKRIATEEPGTDRANGDLAQVEVQLKSMRNAVIVKAVGYLERGAWEFTPELRSLGASLSDITVPVARYRSEVLTLQLPVPGSALRQFSDVPTDHWAAKAILDLRSHGLIHGYPDGSFRG